MSDELVTIKAAFPPIETAIRISGNGDGMRIILDIPESEMAQAVKLLTMRQTVLEVTIKVDKKGRSRAIRTIKRSSSME